MGEATLQLELTNAAGGGLNDFVPIGLLSATSSTHTHNNPGAQRNITVNGIQADGAGRAQSLRIN